MRTLIEELEGLEEGKTFDRAEKVAPKLSRNLKILAKGIKKEMEGIDKLSKGAQAIHKADEMAAGFQVIMSKYIINNLEECNEKLYEALSWARDLSDDVLKRDQMKGADEEDWYNE